MISGIYKITQKDTGKVYIGSSWAIPSRWMAHLSALNSGKHDSTELQKDVRQYGITSLSFEILELIPLGEDNLLSQRETDWTQVLRELYQCYNHLNMPRKFYGKIGVIRNEAHRPPRPHPLPAPRPS